MSQSEYSQKLNGLSSDNERKKRKFDELDYNSDEDNLDNKSKKMKCGKLIKTGNNLQTIRQTRLIQKFQKDNNNILSDDQLLYAKKVIEKKTDEHNINIPTGNITQNRSDKINKFYPIEKLVFQSNTNFSIVETNNIKFEEIQHSYNELELFSLLNSCEYKIKEKSKKNFIIEVKIIKNESEQIIFLLKSDKTKSLEDKDFIEYNPIKCTLNFSGDDINFKEELEIHKDDLGLMMRRLLCYKYDKSG